MILCRDGAGLINSVDTFQLGDPPDPAVLVENARRRMLIPLPQARFSPDPSTGAPQIVGVETWLWVDEATSSDLSVRACVPGAPAYACVVLNATFLDAGFDMGDGTPELTCSGAGRRYNTDASHESQADDQHCGHVYERADPGGSTNHVVTTTFWRVTWSCSYDADLDGGLEAGCGVGGLGVIGRTAAPTPLDVLDLQARAAPS